MEDQRQKRKVIDEQPAGRSSHLNLSISGERVYNDYEGHQSYVDRTWFRGDSARFYPLLRNMRDEEAVVRHVLDGWLPERPLITPETRVTTFGSCFAMHISEWLSRRNYNVLTAKGTETPSDGNAYVVRFGDGMVNTFVMREQFEWALEGKLADDSPWFGGGTEPFEADEEIRLRTRDIFLSTDVFVLTLGLSEIWYDSETGRVFWRAVPSRIYNPEKHRFRVSTVAENHRNLHRILECIRRHCPSARVIFTVSPVRLAATFRPVSCVTANQVSKAVLRAALDEFLRDVEEDGAVHYWPSYEITIDSFVNQWTEDGRHIRNEILDFVMTLFEKKWCTGGEPHYTLTEAWIRAREACSMLPKGLSQNISALNTDTLDSCIAHWRSADREEDVEMLLRRVLEAHGNAMKARDWVETHQRSEAAL